MSLLYVLVVNQMYIRLQVSDVWFVVIKEKEMPSICAEYVVKVSVFVIFYFFLV